MAVLFDGLDTKPKFTIIRKGDRMAVSRDSDQSNIHYESLAHGRTDRKMDPFELTIPAGGGRTDAMPHEGEEFLMVLSGSIAFEYEGTVYTMKEGDDASFDAETAHHAFNPAQKKRTSSASSSVARSDPNLPAPRLDADPGSRTRHSGSGVCHGHLGRVRRPP